MLLGDRHAWKYASAITRCPKTFEQDGFLQGVQLSNADSYCLDGQRLVLVAGSAGQDGAQYRKEIDDASVVTVIGQAQGGGPGAFKVEVKSGDTYYYGDVYQQTGKDFVDINGSNDHGDAYNATIVNGNEVIYSWSLKGIEDAVGNYISFHYIKTAEEQYLSTIDYAGHSNGSLPYRQVKLSYISNPVPKHGFLYGRALSMTQLLSTISLSTDNQVDKVYYLTYRQAASVGQFNFLDSIQACVGETKSDCSTTISFGWTRQTGNFMSASYQPFQALPMSSLGIPSGNNATANIFDMDGDGLADIVYTRNGYWYKRSIASGLETRMSAVGAANHMYAQTIDFDGDGQRDLLVANSATAPWTVLSMKPSSINVHACEPNGYGGQFCEDYPRTIQYTQTNLGVPATGLDGKVIVADVNGDALEDIVFIDGSVIKWYKNLGGRFAAAATLMTFPSGSNVGIGIPRVNHTIKGFESSAMVDVNGDGLTDMLLKVHQIVSYCSTGRGIIYDVTPGECVSDLRGQWRTNQTDNWILYVATGSGFKQQQTIRLSSGMDTLRATDFNGDGLTDIAYVYNNQWYIRLSDGNQFRSAIATGITTTDDQKNNTYFVDVSGDGKADIIAKNSDVNAKIYLANSSSAYGVSAWTNLAQLSHQFNNRLYFADVAGKGRLDVVLANGSNWYRSANMAPVFNNTIHTITDGWGVQTTIDYAHLTDVSNGEYDVYKTQVSSYIDPTRNFSMISPMRVVKKVSTETSASANVSVNYEYGGLLVNRLGRGFAGFELLKTIDNQSHVTTETLYNQIFPRIGLPVATRQIYHGTTLSESHNDYEYSADNDGVYHQTQMTSTEMQRQYGSDGVVRALSNTETQMDYDDWGNVTESHVTVTDPQSGQQVSSITTINSYNGAGGGAAKGRLSATTVQKSRDGQRDDVPSLTTYSNFTYYANGLLKTSVLSPNDARYQQTTTTTYDTYGNKLSESVAAGSRTDGSEVQTRTNYSTYDSRGRFLKSSTNALGDTATYRYNGTTADAVTGKITSASVIDANGRTLLKTYDDWGRQLTETAPDNTLTTYYYQACADVGCSPFSDGYVITGKQKQGTPESQVISDKYGREIGQRVTGFNGEWVTTAKEYDDQGRPIKVYEPGYVTASNYYTESQYDDFGRVVALTMPNGGQSSVQYLGAETLTIDPNGKQKSTTVNALGETLQVTDDIQNQLSFVYSAAGDLLNTYVQAASGEEVLRTQAQYDLYGRKITTIDLDKGTWRYTYNGFGEQLTQTNGRVQSTFYYYDALGRMVRRTEPEGTSCWIYGASSSGTAGLLVTEKRFDRVTSNCADTDVAQQRSLTYDSVGRVKNETTLIGGTRYSYGYSYDAQGRVAEQTFPNNLLTVVNRYNSYGYLYQRADKSSGKAYQTISQMDARGQVAAVKYGNGAQESTLYDERTGLVNNINLVSGGKQLHDLSYDFDDVGNLLSRQMSLSAAPTTYSENYYYDDLYRLYERTISISSGATTLPATFKSTHRMSYDDWGNIKSKTAVGNYSYDATNPYRLLDICSGSNCGTTETKAATKSCPAGYALNSAGTSCQKVESQKASLSYTYSCPSGYALSGTTCTKKETKTATKTTTQKCARGGSYSSVTGQCTHFFTYTGTKMPSGSGVTCSGGEPMGGGRRMWECTETYTATLTQTYACDSGWTLSGTSCNRTLSVAATKNTVYSCPSGWVKSGSTCSRTLTTAVIYNCPSGYTQSGSVCSRQLLANYAMSYDKDGNITNDGSRTLTYSSYDLVTSITKGQESSRFKYDAARNRYQRDDVALENGVLAYYTTYYVGGSYEKVVRSGGGKTALTEQKLYIGNVVITKRSNSTSDEFYLHKDYQGSTTTVTNSAGAVVQQFIYDPWGKQTATFTSGLLASYIAPAATKGYTGHEEISHLDLIHMNGRIYDATIGRFMQADPIVQEPNNSQSYNRYSYVVNNPLSLTDPTGYLFGGLKKLVKKYWKVVVAAVVVYVTAGAATGWVTSWGTTWGTAATATSAATLTTAGGIVTGAIAGAAGGFVGGALTTGTFGGALKGGIVGSFTGASFGGVAGYYGDTWSVSRVGATSFAGGISARVAGGNFADGAKFAFAAAMMRYGYNKAMGYDATWEKGKGLASRDGTYLESDGVPNGPIVFGTNTSGLTEGEHFWGNFWKQGGALSMTANEIPGMNSLAKLHDWMQIGLDSLSGGQHDSWMRTIFNVPAMIPATVINYGALMTNVQLASSINNSNWMRRHNG